MNLSIIWIYTKMLHTFRHLYNWFLWLLGNMDSEPPIWSPVLRESPSKPNDICVPKRLLCQCVWLNTLPTPVPG